MGHHHVENDELEGHDAPEHARGGGFVSGALLGGLVGVAAGLLLAPAAGQDTRRKLRETAVSARDQALATAEEAKSKAVQAVEDTKSKAEDLQQSGRELIEDNKRRLVRTAEAVKHSAQEAWTASPGDTPANGASHPQATPLRQPDVDSGPTTPL